MTKHRTLIIIENYGVYQDCGTPKGHQLTANKNDENIKNDKNVKNNINIYTRV